MPKVKINHARVREVRVAQSTSDRDVPSIESTYDEVDPELSLAWRNSPEGVGHVQFGAELEISLMERLIAEAKTLTPQISRIEVWFPVIDRTEINTAVRTLRTARDKALGADA